MPPSRDDALMAARLGGVVRQRIGRLEILAEARRRFCSCSDRLLQVDRLQAVQVISGALGVGSCSENGAFVALEHGRPMIEIAGVIVAELGREVEAGAEIGAAQLGHEFLGCVVLFARSSEGTRETPGMSSRNLSGMSAASNSALGGTVSISTVSVSSSKPGSLCAMKDLTYAFSNLRRRTRSGSSLSIRGIKLVDPNISMSMGVRSVWPSLRILLVD
jgi:hypothetical protein